MVWDTLERKGNDFIAHVYKKNDEHSMQTFSDGSVLSSRIYLEIASPNVDIDISVIAIIYI